MKKYDDDEEKLSLIFDLNDKIPEEVLNKGVVWTVCSDGLTNSVALDGTVFYDSENDCLHEEDGDTEIPLPIFLERKLKAHINRLQKVFQSLVEFNNQAETAGTPSS